MIPRLVLILSFESGRKTHQKSRPTYGKIKDVPPCGRQAVATACLPAGASVGARAAREQKCNDSNINFGTRALPLLERADK